MKSRFLCTTSCLGLLGLLAMPVSLAAQAQAPKPARYTITDLGTLPGGTFSQAIGVNRNGLVNGASALPDGTLHAVLWYKGSIADIGAPGLGGPNSGAFGVNEGGQASGLAETSASDPNGEDFCGYGTHLICLPFQWHSGVMTPLPTLGGNNGEAGQINNRGEVAGNAENTTPDSTCPPGGPQVFQEKPVVWENRHIKELDTLLGDPDGWAFGINDNGKVVGASGICSPLNPQTGVYILSRHALLWDKGKAINLGNLGGTGAFGPGNIAGEVNNHGQVVGTSDLAGDTTYHAFLWTEKTGIRDLGTLQGDFASAGLGINDRGDVVGSSFDASFNPRAFLWHNGRMIDLNKLTPTDSPMYLLFAHGINSRGEIAGFGVNSTGEVHAFLAIPCDRNHDDAD
jgi:probable HAF family extracellular repeat protein